MELDGCPVKLVEIKKDNKVVVELVKNHGRFQAGLVITIGDAEYAPV